MHTWIIRGCEAAAAQHVAALCDFARSHEYRSTDCIARLTGSADKAKLYPVMLIRIHIAQKRRAGIQIVQHGVDLAVVEQVAKCGSARRVTVASPVPFTAGTSANLPPPLFRNSSGR